MPIMISFKSRAPSATVGPKDHVPRCVRVIIPSPLSEAANWQEMKSGRQLEGPCNYSERPTSAYLGRISFRTLGMLLQAYLNRFVASRFCLKEVASTNGRTAMEIFTSVRPLLPTSLLFGRTLVTGSPPAGRCKCEKQGSAGAKFC
jgi:hypothetical protein